MKMRWRPAAGRTDCCLGRVSGTLLASVGPQRGACNRPGTFQRQSRCLQGGSAGGKASSRLGRPRVARHATSNRRPCPGCPACLAGGRGGLMSNPQRRRMVREACRSNRRQGSRMARWISRRMDASGADDLCPSINWTSTSRLRASDATGG